MGTPHYATEILQTLIDAQDIQVALVLTQPDKPVGRKRLLTAPAVKTLALAHDITVLQPSKLSDEGIYEAIQNANADFIVVAAFGQILPKNILDLAPCINLHASLLPQYRGASPLQQSLLNGDKHSGVTSMMMEEGLDTGDILQKIVFEIPQDMRLHALMAQLTQDACTLTLSTLREFEHITPQAQDDNQASLCKKIKKSDGELDFEDAHIVYNKYRAFEGWPKVFASDGTKIEALRLLEEEKTHQKLEILAFEKDAVHIGCSLGSLSIGSLQPPSKKPMSAKAYCLGRGLKIGDTLF